VRVGCSLALDSKAVVRTVVDILAVEGRGAQRNGYPASGLEGLESEVGSRDAQEVRAVQNCLRDGGVLGPKRIVARKRDYSSEMHQREPSHHSKKLFVDAININMLYVSFQFQSCCHFP
jgi:hypothetical protein